jgi:probable rRNA maturation factor
MEITLQVQAGITVPSWDVAEAAAIKLLANAGREQAEISVVLVDDARIRDLNRDWRGQDRATDVLSWPQEQEPTPGAPDVLGDVVISYDTAVRQANTRQWSVEEELALLLVHGILHLLGYEDETDSGAETMRQRETELLGKPLEKIDSVAS